MAGKRYALFMGSYTNLPHINYPINADTCNELLVDLKKSFKNTFGNGEYAFTWPDKPKNEPEPEVLELTPDTGKVITKIQELDNVITDDDIFLFYYFGHGYIAKNKLCLAFQHYGPEKNPKNYSVNLVIDYARECGAKKIVLILDCCYGGHSSNYLNAQDVEYYLLSASYQKYSKHTPEAGGIFTRELINILNDRNIEKFAQPHANSISIQDLFHAAEANLNNLRATDNSIPFPYNYGNLGNYSLLSITKTEFNKPAFDVRARFNTIYKKIFFLAEYMIDKAVTLDEIYQWITIEKKHTSFKISDSDYVDKYTVSGYLDILKNLNFVKISQHGKYTLDNWGVFAIRDSGLEFNKYLTRSLLNWLTSKDLSWNEVSEYRMMIHDIFKDDLILKIIVPNYEHFETAFYKNNNLPMIDKKELKLILQLYSFTEDLQRMDSNTYFL